MRTCRICKKPLLGNMANEGHVACATQALAEGLPALVAVTSAANGAAAGFRKLTTTFVEMRREHPDWFPLD